MWKTTPSGGLPKMQTAADDEIEKIVRRITAIERRLEMIARDEELFAPVRRSKGCAGRIVSTAGQKLQGEKWVGGAAFTQIDFDRVGLPGCALVRARHDEIECEATDDPGVAQQVAHPGRVPRDRARVGRVGRENAAEITLPARSAEHLIVGREQFHSSRAESRRSCTLGLRTSAAPTPTRSSTTPPRSRNFSAYSSKLVSGFSNASRAPARRWHSFAAAPRFERSTMALPSPDTPSFSFTTACAMDGRCARM